MVSSRNDKKCSYHRHRKVIDSIIYLLFQLRGPDARGGLCWPRVQLRREREAARQQRETGHTTDTDEDVNVSIITDRHAHLDVIDLRRPVSRRRELHFGNLRSLISVALLTFNQSLVSALCCTFMIIQSAKPRHTNIFPKGVVHRVENGWGLTKVAAVLLNGLLW